MTRIEIENLLRKARTITWYAEKVRNHHLRSTDAIPVQEMTDSILGLAEDMTVVLELYRKTLPYDQADN